MTLPTILLSSDEATFRARWIGLDETHHAKARKLAIWTEAWLKACATGKRNSPRWMVLTGEPGCGKSHAMRAARRFIEIHSVDLWYGSHGRWWHTPPQCCHAVWSRVIEYGEIAWADWFAELETSHVVFLDDIGGDTDRFRTGAPAERLRLVLEASRNKWLIATTNVPREAIADRFDSRVADRLSAARWLSLAGVPSYRPKQATP